MAYDEKLAERVRRGLKAEKNLREQKMFGGVAYLLAGRMSVGILGEDLVVRVDPAEEGKYLRYPDVRPMDFTGRPMRGFLYVGPKATASGSGLASWIKRGTSYAKSLPVKAQAPRAKRRSRAK